MMDRIKQEPVLISVLVGNLLALGAAFGLNLSQEQTAAVMGVVTTLVVIVFGRSNVTPNVKVIAMEDRVGPVAAEASELTNGTPVKVVELKKAA